MQDAKRKEVAMEKAGAFMWSTPWKPRVHRSILYGL